MAKKCFSVFREAHGRPLNTANFFFLQDVLLFSFHNKQTEMRLGTGGPLEALVSLRVKSGLTKDRQR